VRKQKKQLEELLKKVNMKNKLNTMLKSHQNLYFLFNIKKNSSKKNLQFAVAVQHCIIKNLK
jgi:hypothetical protein